MESHFAYSTAENGKQKKKEKKSMTKHVIYPIFIAIRKLGLSFSILPYT